MYKQNNPMMLTKQGAFYQINLGKNSGPFLSKDIMHSNHKSISLLTGTQILKSHKSMVNTLKVFQGKQSNKLTHHTSAAQNFNSQCKFLQSQLNVLFRSSNQLKLQQKKLRRQIQNLHEVISKQSSDLLEQSLPILKALMKKIKQNSANQAAVTYTMARQLNTISGYRQTIVNNVKNCQNKTTDLEKIFGSNNNVIEKESTEIYTQ